MNSSKGYYEEKYLKYKYKYLQLKKLIQIGGGEPGKMSSKDESSSKSEKRPYTDDGKGKGKSDKKVNVDDSGTSGSSSIDIFKTDDGEDKSETKMNVDDSSIDIDTYKTPVKDLSPNSPNLSRLGSNNSINFISNTPRTTYGIHDDGSPHKIGQQKLISLTGLSSLSSSSSALSLSSLIDFFSINIKYKNLIDSFIRECNSFLTNLQTPYQSIYPLEFNYGNTGKLIESISTTCSVSHTSTTDFFPHVPIADLPLGFRVSNKLLLENNSNQDFQSCISSRVYYNIQVSIEFDNKEQIKDGSDAKNFLNRNEQFKNLLQFAKNSKKHNMYHWYPIADVLIQALGNISCTTSGKTQSIYSHLSNKKNIFICDGANIAAVTETSSPFLTKNNMDRAENLCAWLNLADKMQDCATILLANYEIGQELENIGFKSVYTLNSGNLLTIHQTSSNNLIVLMNTRDHPTPTWIKPATISDQKKINDIIDLILYLISQSSSSNAKLFDTRKSITICNQLHFWKKLDKITKTSTGSIGSTSTRWSFQTDIDGLLFLHPFQGYKQKGFDDGAFSLLAYMLAGLFKGARILTNDRCKTEQKSLGLYTLFSCILDEIKISSSTDTSALSSTLYDEIFNRTPSSIIARYFGTSESVLFEIFKEMDNQKISSSHQGIIGNMLSSTNSIDDILAGAIQIIGPLGARFNGIFDFIAYTCKKYNIDPISLLKFPTIISSSSYRITDKKTLLENLLNKIDTVHLITGLPFHKLFSNPPFTTFDDIKIQLGLSDIVHFYDKIFGIIVPKISKLYLLDLSIEDLKTERINLIKDGKEVTKTIFCRNFVPNMKDRKKKKLYGDSKCSVCKYALMFHYNEQTFTKYKKSSSSLSSSLSPSFIYLPPIYKNISVTRLSYTQDRNTYTVDDETFILKDLIVDVEDRQIVLSGLISLLWSITNINIKELREHIHIIMTKILNNKDVQYLFTLYYETLNNKKPNIENYIEKRTKKLDLPFYPIDFFWLFIFKRLKLIEQDILIFSPSSESTESSRLLKLVQIGTNNDSPEKCICVIKNENSFSQFIHQGEGEGDIYSTIILKFSEFYNNFNSETDLSEYLVEFIEELKNLNAKYWDTSKESTMSASASDSTKSGGGAPK
jgi:hypothetical protein